jgi:hypothetical protein
MTANIGSVFLSGQFHQIAVALHDVAVILGLMGQLALGAILDAVLGIGKAAAALVTQGVQRTVAEQAIEAVGIVGGMAGKKLTFLMLKEGVLFAFPIGFVGHDGGSFPNGHNFITKKAYHFIAQK